MAEDSGKLRFKEIYETFRTLLSAPKECAFYLHSPVGLIAVRRFHFNHDLGFVVVDGFDETKKHRFFALMDEIICSCALEVRKNKESLKNPVGFKSNLAPEEDQS